MKPIVLLFVACYLPGFRGGGPIRTIANLVDKLGNDFDFKIVTMDRDLGDTCPYANISANEWHSVGKAQVLYTSSDMRSYKSLFRLLNETKHDILYLNGFFQPNFTVKPLILRKLKRSIRRPTIVAPHGEFSPNALSLKRFKKSVFMIFERFFGLYENVVWHASTKYEALDIHKSRGIPVDEVLVAKNIVAEPEIIDTELLVSERIESSVLSVCFLSRISPMKNLTYALKILSEVKIETSFNIYGPKESADYWKACQELIDKLPSNIMVSYLGSVSPENVRNIISKHDIFFVPTLGENFGHVFIEALSSGVPILVSDKTPWRGLKERNVGWDISLDKPSDFVNALHDVGRFNKTRRKSIRKSCIEYAFDQTRNSSVVEMNKNLFLQALNAPR